LGPARFIDWASMQSNLAGDILSSIRIRIIRKITNIIMWTVIE